MFYIFYRLKFSIYFPIIVTPLDKIDTLLVMRLTGLVHIVIVIIIIIIFIFIMLYSTVLNTVIGRFIDGDSYMYIYIYVYMHICIIPTNELTLLYI